MRTENFYVKKPILFYEELTNIYDKFPNLLDEFEKQFINYKINSIIFDAVEANNRLENNVLDNNVSEEETNTSSYNEIENSYNKSLGLLENNESSLNALFQQIFDEGKKMRNIVNTNTEKINKFNKEYNSSEKKLHNYINNSEASYGLYYDSRKNYIVELTNILILFLTIIVGGGLLHKNKPN